jgi:hypothetical protein
MKILLALLVFGSLSLAYTAKTGIVKGKVNSLDEKTVTLLIDGKKHKVDRKHFAGQKLKVGQEAQTEIEIKELEGSNEPPKSKN